MSEKMKNTSTPQSQKTREEAKKERLAKALRENLQRRKQHARNLKDKPDD